jgi:predicted RNA-binding protein
LPSIAHAYELPPWALPHPKKRKQIVPDMSFIKNIAKWSASLRTAMQGIPEEDYQRILKSAKKSDK